MFIHIYQAKLGELWLSPQRTSSTSPRRPGKLPTSRLDLEVMGVAIEHFEKPFLQKSWFSGKLIPKQHKWMSITVIRIETIMCLHIRVFIFNMRFSYAYSQHKNQHATNMPIASCLVTLLHIPPPRGFRPQVHPPKCKRTSVSQGWSTTDDPQGSRLNKVIFPDSEYDYIYIWI